MTGQFDLGDVVGESGSLSCGRGSASRTLCVVKNDEYARCMQPMSKPSLQTILSDATK